VCGICGIVSADTEPAPDRSVLESMNNALVHRGPDGAGIMIEDHFGFGHRRLSVIDIDGGVQPMTDSEGIVTITFNGEIYNFLELRDELIAKGVVFQTRSDTEVLLKGYLHWGIGVLDRLLGMFAFAIWDRRTRELYVVRDRLGVKPLYWTPLVSGGVAFASELSSLRYAMDSPNEMNRSAACEFFALSYVTGSNSILQRAYRLPAGSFLKWKSGASPEIKTYWDLAEIWQSRADTFVPQENQDAKFLSCLETATKDRLITDVPLGAFLSGGLDSSGICALIMKAEKELETFSIGFKEKSYDELPYARLMAEELGTKHRDEIVSCESPDLLLEIANHLDEPFADTSIVPTYVLCRSARKHLTVALSGDGGDELLAGYVTHSADKIHSYLSHLPKPLVKGMSAMVNLIPDNRNKVGTVFKLKQFMRGAHLDAAHAHASWRMLATDSGLRDLIHPDFWTDDAQPFRPFVEAYNEVPSLSPLDRQLYVDYKTWLVDDILTKTDRASMAHGLEVRSPFLDHRLIEHCAGLSADQKLNGFKGKYILGKAMAGLVPQKIVERPKRGFNSPVSHWIAGSWRELVQDTFNETTVKNEGILNSKTINTVLQEHLAGHRDNGLLIFNLLMFRLWNESHA